MIRGKPLRIFGVISRPFPILGGAHITHFTFLRRLQQDHGCQCYACGSAAHMASSSFGGLRVRSFRDPDELKRTVLAFRPDAIFGGLEACVSSLRLAKRYGVPHLTYVHAFELCPPDGAERERWQVLPDHTYPSPEAAAWVLRETGAVLAPSRFMKERLRAVTGIASVVLYPEFDPVDVVASDRTRRSKRFITGVCGYRHKGADIFLELARRFPHEEFLVAGFVGRHYRAPFEQAPNVRVWPFGPARRFLGVSKVVLAPSQWPEPFGRIAVEAMANGIPTLASLTGGLTEIVGDSPLGVADFAQVDAWEEKLSNLLRSESVRAENVREGRRLSAPFMAGASTSQLHDILGITADEQQPSFDDVGVVALQGPANRKTAYSIVNRCWAEWLPGEGRYSFVRGRAEDAVPGVADVTVFHDLAHDFKELPIPDEGKLVVQRTWDFGPFPRAWVKLVNDSCDRLWVPTRWLAKQAAAGGVEPGRIRVIPHGVDKRVFRPEGRRAELPTGKSFRFLFVGAPVLRKGIDVLLESFGQAFIRADDVCLVIKSNPEDPVYDTEDFTQRIRAAVRDDTVPEVVLLECFMGEEELASVYRACDVGVFPYRAEGFCLPILEAMACGLPSIVPRFGASLDFCSSRTSFQMPVKRIAMPVGRNLAINSLGFREDIHAVDFCEVQVDTLKTFLRLAWQCPARVREAKAAHGVEVARGRFTWARVASMICRDLDALIKTTPPVRVRRRRAEMERRRKVFAAARDIFLGR